MDAVGVRSPMNSGPGAVGTTVRRSGVGGSKQKKTMTTAKRLSSTRPGGSRESGGRSSRSGIQPSKQAEPAVPARRDSAGSVGVDTAHFSRDALVQALDEVSWTAEKQARVIDGLERLVQQLQRDVRKERLLNERSQKQMLNEQDQFIEELLAEHEEALTKVVAERDEALRQMERLERLVPQSDVPREPPELPPGGADGPRRAATQEALELRQQLAWARRRIGKLTSECRRSRDVLHRVMHQRDEAQLAVAQLMHEIRDSLPLSTDRNDAEPFGAEAAVDEPTLGDDARVDRTTPTATTSPSTRPSPLAIALASTHPKRRRTTQRSARGWNRESTTLPGVAPEQRAQRGRDTSSEDGSE
jgi:hypothetical protein